MQLQGQIDDLGFSPSFNCYSSDNSTSKAAAKVSREFKQEEAAQFDEFSDVDEEDFEFSFVLAGEEVSAKELAQEGRIVFPVFNTDLLMKDELDRTVLKETDDDDFPVMIPLQKLFFDESEESLSSSSSETDESEGKPSGTLCVSGQKAAVGSPTLGICKKSRSTGSGSKRWKIRDLLRRSNSEGRESIFFLCPKKLEASKQKRNVNSGEASKVAGKLKTASSPSFHELFYVQKRAEKNGDKMKSYLPYRQDLLGFFVQVNGNGNKKSPF